MELEKEKLGSIPISGGPGTISKKDGKYQKSKVIKLRVPKKFVDELGIIMYDKNREKIRVDFYIRPSLKKAIEGRNFELIYEFNKDILGEIVEKEELNVEEIEKEVTSEEGDFGIEKIINEEEE